MDDHFIDLATTAEDLLAISRYVMPALPLQPATLGFLFGTRHGVDEFDIDSILVIGKVCAMRRYLMTRARHWPGVTVSACPINSFGMAAERRHEHDEFRDRVLAAYRKIPHYLQQDFLRELDGHAPYPSLAAGP